jgi:iron complex outermembrane recepter protein
VNAIAGDPTNRVTQLANLGVAPDEGSFQANLDAPIYNDSQSWGHALTTNIYIADYTATSISSYREWNSIIAGDVDGLPTNPLGLILDSAPLTSQRQISQELRFSSEEEEWGSFVVGVYYFNQTVSGRIKASFVLPEMSFEMPLVPNTPPFVVTYPQQMTQVTSFSEVETQNYGAFGEMTLALGDDLRSILGLRYNHDHQAFIKETTRIDSGGLSPVVTPFDPGLGLPDAPVYGDVLNMDPNQPRFGGDVSENSVSAKIALEWDVAFDAMLYTSAAQGYKGPAFDVSTIQVSSMEAIDPETSETYEIGIKSSWFDHRFTLNVAAFYADYEDFQAQALFEAEPARGPKFFLVNAGAVNTQGVELDFQAKPLAELYIVGGIAYTDTTIRDFEQGNCSEGQQFRQECSNSGGLGIQDLSGGELPFVSKIKVNLAATYTLDIESAPFYVIVGAQARWQDDMLFEMSQDPFTVQGAYSIVDLSISLSDKLGHYTVTGFVKNVFDEQYADIIFAQAQEFTPNVYVQHLPKLAQRTAGIEFRYDW